MAFKFERLEVWRLALDYADPVYALSASFPEEEKFNLTSQIRRAVTSIGLNIAEGSTGQTNAEQVRFLGLALRSLLEVVACLHMARRRGYIQSATMEPAYRAAEELAAKIQAMRNTLSPDKPWVREETATYEDNERRPTMDDGQ